MVGCFVPKCTSGHRKGEKCHLFRPSSTSGEQWVNVMKQIRKDKQFDPLNDNHRVCSLHFDEKCILSEYSFTIDGRTHTIPRGRWTLASNAVPSIFKDLPLSVKPSISKPRRILLRNCDENRALPFKKRKRSDRMHDNDLSIDKETNELQNQDEIRKDDVVTWWEDRIEHHQWKLDTNHVDICCFNLISYPDNIPTTKSILMNFGAGAGITPYINGKNVLQLLSNEEAILSWSNILCLMDKMETLSICRGLNGFSSVNSCNRGVKLNSVWFSKNCEQVGDFIICTKCKLLHQTLLRLFHKSLHKSTPTPRKRLYYYKQSSARLRSSNIQLKRELFYLKTYVKKLDIVSVEKRLNDIDLSPQLRQTIMTSLQSAKVKSKKGMRYSTAWLLECLLLRIKSPSAYRHLRESNILPLPHPSTLNKLIAGQPCEFGVNESALTSIELAFRGKSRRDRQGVLIFDEIQLRETINYNHHSHRLDGYIDYGAENEDLVDDEENLANHALVIMYRPINDSWVQPIAAFATRNAAKGRAIQKVVMQAILKLEFIGAEVLSVVCDGSKPNKSFWKMSGVGYFKGDIINKIIHPCDETRYLYFTCDVPHLFKCIRNHCAKYVNFKFFGHEVNFTFYEYLLNEDGKRQFGLRKCPKLTKSHVRPNCFEKMVVSLATQLLSRSVATGLEFYRKLGVSSFKNSEGTQWFTQVMNDVFDALNTRFPIDGIKFESNSYVRLQSFYDRLITMDSGKMQKKDDIVFASHETIIALKVSIKSTIEMIDFLIADLGYNYVLTAKMNQDCLEKFFGLIRAAGGREDHPTVSNFIQLFRLLSLYSPVRKALKGNVRTDEEIAVLVDLEKTFRQSAVLRKQRLSERKRIIDEIIVDKLLDVEMNCEHRATQNTSTTVYPESIFDQNIVYYLCGFICHRAINLIGCSDCIQAISVSQSEAVSNKAFLTNLLDYGGLMYPSQRFFEMVSEWERCICRVLGHRLTNGDIIIDCLKNVSQFSLDGIGCIKEGHGEDLVKILLPYYVTMRIHFYTRSIRRSLGKGKATKNKRKESKLVSN